ncbi:MAG: SGNH/GDSL hydrolase family protein [Verrucomicrobiota bacterium]
MLLEKNNKMLFIGDSITDCGRSPEGKYVNVEDMGGGYVMLVIGWLQALYPERHLCFVNKGVSGNTVLDLKARWQADVLDQKPDWLSIMIGVNDVWRQFDRPHHMVGDNYITPERFAETYQELIDKVRPDLKGLIIASPFYIEPNKDEPMRQRMDVYAGICRKIAEKNDALFINTQQAFDHYLSRAHHMTLSADRVHPNVAGHTMIAREYLKNVEAFPYGLR